MPYYKKKKYIKSSIQSVLKQTYKYFELIIVYDDPGSQDIIFLKRLAKQDKRIKLIINKKNLGAGLSRNQGMDCAKGEFIAFLDSDDLWKKNKLQKQIDFMKKNKCDFSHTSYEIIDHNEKIVGKRIARNFYQVDDLIKSCDIGLLTVVLSKRIINLGVRFPYLKTKEDFVLWLKILQLNIPIISINETLASWRKLDHSLSSSIIQKLMDAFRVYHKFMKYNLIKSLYYVTCLSLNYFKKTK